MTTRGRVAVSPTKLDAWQDCRLRYRMKYIDRLVVDGSWAHLSMGNAIHAALRDWFDIEGDARTPAAAAALVWKNWSSLGFRDSEQSAAWNGTAAAMVERYCVANVAASPVGRERSLAALTDTVTISGRIDRLDERGDELVVIDYKTGKRVPSDDDARVSRALAIYALITQRTLRRPAFEVELHHVPSGAVASYRHTPESLERHLSRVDSIGRDIAAAEDSGTDADFPPSPGPLCAWCDFRDACPASAGVPAAARWAGLPEAADDTDTFPA